MMDTPYAGQLDKANKLIFIRGYEEAQSILDGVVRTPNAREDILVQLRRIELAIKLEQVEQLDREFDSWSENNPGDLVPLVCLLLLRQMSEKISCADAIESYQEIMKSNGPHAGCFYGIGFALEVEGNVDRAIYNYEQSVTIDQSWYPSYFGLSQLHYQKEDLKKGDHFFYLFEKIAPYNVYGNFDTHRKLSAEFLDEGLYSAAETALTTLRDWWVDNKGQCPDEIKIYECLAVAKIHRAHGREREAESRIDEAYVVCNNLLNATDAQESVLYFVAKTLEEHGEFEYAVQFYRRILQVAGSNPAMVQKIGGQFLSLGEFDLARDLFQEAYASHPDNPEIRFCLLVSKLKQTSVNVEEYLIGKERLKQLLASDADRVEMLALLHSLLAKFTDDPEVHQHMAEVYLRLGNVDKAKKHFERMYELDSHSSVTVLKYITFLVQHDNASDAMRLLDEFVEGHTLTPTQQTEVDWLRSTFLARHGDYKGSQAHLKKILAGDPWNVSYLVQQIVNLTALSDISEDLVQMDEVMEKLATFDENELDWESFDSQTELLRIEHQYPIVYARTKLRYLYTDGDQSVLQSLVESACVYNASQGTFDFLRLLNTNFDSAHVYWALGVLYKELWQLEVAAMWFNQTILHPTLSKELQAKAYIELADCEVWLNKEVRRAIEYAKLAIDLDHSAMERANTTLAHAYLKTGQVKSAESFLGKLEQGNEVEATYLAGLLEYRNGSPKKANAIWKPLLTIKSESIRQHNIKQEILRYYFDSEPYLKVN